MSHFSKILLSLAILITSVQLSGQTHQNWNVVFLTSESSEAQQHFLDGVTNMHLHMFEDAERDFQRAQQISPDFAMAYWGEALNNHRTIWSIHRLEEARAVLNRLGPTPAARAAKAPTAREKAYLGAIEKLFGVGTQAERELAYSEAMQQLAKTYSNDVEARAWYALSLMRVIPFGMTREQKRSLMAGLSMEVLSANPRHPGANRYLIQSTDDPENTDIGILAVNNLLQIDTDAAEALHIPSHYYLQHGMWEQVAESNMQAFDSSMGWVEDNGWSLQDLNSHNYGHLLQFANYGYLQAGNFDAALSIRERVRADYIASGLAEEIGVPFADVHARWVLDLERWDEAEAMADIAREYSLDNPGLWQAIGIAASRSGNLELATEAVTVLSSLDDNPAAEGPVSARMVEGLIHLARGNNEIALSMLREANDLNWERPVTIIGVPPRPLKPTMEVYGEALLQVGDPEAALGQFQLGLTRYRGRTNLMLGAARAAAQLGEMELSQRYYTQLAETWQNAAEDHPFTAEVMSALAP